VQQHRGIAGRACKRRCKLGLACAALQLQQLVLPLMLSSFEPCAMADPFSIDASRAHIHHTGQYSRTHATARSRSHALTRPHARACTHARMYACTQAGMRACTRVRLHTQTHRHTHCHSMPSHVASAVACAYGGVRDSVQMRRCSRRQRCRQILCALLHRRTLLCAQARQRSCESRRPIKCESSGTRYAACWC
jgi:hypothetical protein